MRRLSQPLIGLPLSRARRPTAHLLFHWRSKELLRPHLQNASVSLRLFQAFRLLAGPRLLPLRCLEPSKRPKVGTKKAPQRTHKFFPKVPFT